MRYGLLGVLFALLSGPVLGQTDSITKPLPTYGLKVGFNFSWVGGKTVLPEEAYSIGGGGVYGFMAIFPFTKQLSTELNLYFSGKGYNAEHYVPGSDTSLVHHTAEGRFSYLDLPVLLQYHLSEKSRTFSVVAGPQFSFLLRRRESLHLRNGRMLKTYEADSREEVNPVVVGYVLGAHLNWRLFRLGLRYAADLTSVASKDRRYFGAPLRTRLVQLEMGFPVGTIKPKYTGKPI